MEESDTGAKPSLPQEKSSTTQKKNNEPLDQELVKLIEIALAYRPVCSRCAKSWAQTIRKTERNIVLDQLYCSNVNVVVS